MFPHLIILSIWVGQNKSAIGGKILEDIRKWKEIKGLSSKSNLYSFILLLMTYSELRSVFYWRLGRFSKYFFFWLPGRTNLHLFSNPHNVGGDSMSVMDGERL